MSSDSEQPVEFDSKAFLKNASTHPGTYRMYDDKGEMLYVGKATLATLGVKMGLGKLRHYNGKLL